VTYRSDLALRSVLYRAVVAAEASFAEVEDDVKAPFEMRWSAACCRRVLARRRSTVVELLRVFALRQALNRDVDDARDGLG